MPDRRHIGLLLVAAVLAGCAPVQRARLSDAPPKDGREYRAEFRIADPNCPPAFGWFLPGIGQLCYGKLSEGVTLTALTGAEVVTTVELFRRTDLTTNASPPFVSLLTLQYLWAYAGGDMLRERQLADAKRYVPRDSLGELAAAPFNPRVLARPDVWAGILGGVGLAMGLSWLTGSELRGARFRSDPGWFGADLDPPAAYGLAGATGTAVFTHVAIGEEMLFRGIVQSSLARRQGETAGWLLGSAVFAAAHLPNVLLTRPAERTKFLAVSMPLVTGVGTYLGASYRWNDYSLAPPVALHFWYDLLVSGAQFALTDEPTLIGTSFSIPF